MSSRTALIIAKPYDAELVRKAALEAGHVALLSDGSDRPEELVELDRPRVVVLSLRLARVNALQLLRTIRAGAHGAEVPLVLVSDPDSAVTTVHDAVELGADELVLRPLDVSRLVGTIAALLAPPGEGGASRAARAAEIATDAAQAQGARPAEAPPDPRPARREPPRQTRERIAHKHAQVCEGTYYGVLELDEDATAAEVVRAHERLRAEFEALEAAADDLGPDAAEMLAEINTVLAEALAVLGNTRLRQAYTEHLR